MAIYKSKKEFNEMQKNPQNIFSTIEIDPVSGEYFTVIPEEVVNEMGYYEETKLHWHYDSDGVLLIDETP